MLLYNVKNIKSVYDLHFLFVLILQNFFHIQFKGKLREILVINYLYTIEINAHFVVKFVYCAIFWKKTGYLLPNSALLYIYIKITNLSFISRQMSISFH